MGCSEYVNQCNRDDPLLVDLSAINLLEEVRIYRNANGKILTESALAEAKRSADKASSQLKAKQNEMTKIMWPNQYVPYFTVMETQLLMENIGNRDKIMSMSDDEPTKKEKIDDLVTKLKNTNDEEEVKNIKDTLISLGYNPEVEYNEESFLKRISNAYTKFIKETCDIVDKRTDIDNKHMNATNPKFPSIYISIYEDGNVVVVTRDDIKKYDLLKIDEEVDIYGFKIKYAESSSQIDYDYSFDCLKEFGYLLPSNVCAALVVDKYFKAHNYKGQPMVKLLYSGSNINCPRNTILNYMNNN